MPVFPRHDNKWVYVVYSLDEGAAGNPEIKRVGVSKTLTDQDEHLRALGSGRP